MGQQRLTWIGRRAARVRGVSGAQYRKVRTPEELAAFCAAHGVEPPRSLTWDSE